MMITLPGFLSFLLPLPAALKPVADPPPRRRAIRELGLSRYLLQDVGIEDMDNAANDPRWSLRPDLER